MRKQVMSSAWELVKSAGLTLSEALKKAWEVFKFKERLKEWVSVFYYKKKDGTVRRALGTLDPSLIDYEYKGSKKENYKSITYWDMEANGFRSFSIGSLI